MRISVKIPNSNGVASNATATFDLPIGRRYHALYLQYGGTSFALSDMTEIRVIANGEVIQRYSGADRDTMNQFDRLAAAAGILALKFDRSGLYQQKGEESTAIQTGSKDPATGVAVTSFKLEVDIAATATAPTLTVIAVQSDNNAAAPGPGLIRRVMRYSRVFSAAGSNEISDFPKGTEGNRYIWLNRAFFKTANTLDLEIDRSNFAIFQRTAATNTRIQSNGVRSPQAGWYVYDPTEEGYDWEPISFFQAPNAQGIALPYQDFRYKLNSSAGETVTAYVEYLGKLAG
jgi:hypothetical protein